MLLQVHHSLHGLEVEHKLIIVNIGIFGIRAMRRGELQMFYANLTLPMLLQVHRGVRGFKVEHEVITVNMGIFRRREVCATHFKSI